MNIIPIAFAFDNNLIMPAGVCISSLLMNAKADTYYDIFVLMSSKGDLDTESLDKLKQYYSNFNIHYIAVEPVFDASYQIRGITPATYYRLMIPEYITEYDKVIYSDVDVIFREDLAEWYNQTSFGDEYVAGVNSLSHLNPITKKYYTNELGLDPSRIIYAGNIILNSRKIREDNIIEKFKDHAYKKYRYQDLDILNIVCLNRIIYMSPAFCVTTDVMQYAIGKDKVLSQIWSEQEVQHVIDKGIIHYNGQKPWKGGCINFDIWWEYYRKSPFFDLRYYYQFFYNMLNDYDRLPLFKRIKILLRYFIYGRK